MSGNGPSHFQVVPPMGQRAPLGGAQAQPLLPGAAPPPLGGAPVPPAQPPWAAPAPVQHAATPPPVVIVNPQGRDVTAEIVEGLQFGAAFFGPSGLAHYYPFLAIEQVRLLAQQHGLTLNETPPAAPAPAQAAPAPGGAPIAAEKRKRLNKKDDIPRIEQFLKEGASAAQISDAIGLQLASVEKAIASLASPPSAPDPRQDELPHVGTPANPISAVQAPVPYAPPAVETETLSGAVERALFVAHEVMTFARERSVSLREIRAAARLLEVVEVAGG